MDRKALSPKCREGAAAVEASTPAMLTNKSSRGEDFERLLTLHAAN
jgi:hypothetical protein